MKNSKFLIAVFCLMVFAMAGAASASTIKINPDKTISINGVKTFPVFAYKICQTSFPPCEPSKATEFTYTITDWQPAYPETTAYLDVKKPVFEAAKVYWTAGIYPGSAGDKVSTTPSYRDSPYFFGYTQQDEPDASGTSESVLIGRYAQYKARDANHPIITNLWGYLWKYKDTADILQFDSYPFRSNIPRADAIVRWEEGIKKYAFSPGKTPDDFNKPIYAVLQANGLVSEGNILVPTVQEVKTNTYTAITVGVQGIGYWSYHHHDAGSIDQGFFANPTLYNGVKKIARELHSINNVLVLPTVANSWEGKKNTATVSIAPNPSRTLGDGYVGQTFNYILKKDASTNQWYLIVVNKFSTSQANIKITIPGLSGTGTMTAKTLGLETSGSQMAGRTLTVTNGQFTDTFDGYAVHIYQVCSGTCSSPNPLPTCYDNIQNQDETGIDCGGPCPACGSPGTQKPYGGSARAIPGTIQIEDYDTGGEGVAYHDTDSTNVGGPYRTDGVDIYPTADIGGGYKTGLVLAGEWLEYTVNVGSSGTYDIQTRLSLLNGNGGTFHIEFDGVDKTGLMAIPGTGSWETWQTVTKSGVYLTAGQHIMKIVFDTISSDGSTGNFNYVRFQSSSGGDPPTQITLKPGWNQISSPLAAGIDLATIESSCTILQYKNQKFWSWNAQAQSWINPTKIEPLKGYWIYVAYVCTVPLSGTPATFSSLQLYSGWNKVSAQGSLSAIEGTCAGHITGNWIWNWDKTTTPEKWIHPTTMQLDKGYWIKVDTDCVLGG